MKIAVLVQNVRPFCSMGVFGLLVELHREGSAPASCAAGLFFFFMNMDVSGEGGNMEDNTEIYVLLTCFLCSN